MMDDKIVIFKNDKIGDLIHSTNCINKIILNHQNTEINIFLSNYNKEMKFLFKNKNVIFHVISEKINFFQKLKIFYFFLVSKINEVYILKPSYYFFLLPFFFYFKKINFFAICINNFDYYRPSLFLRRFLKRYVVNDRGTNKIRKSINDLHLNLINNQDKSNYDFAILNNKKLKVKTLNNYFLVHYNKFKFNKLNWNLEDFFTIIEELKIFNKNIVVTNDIDDYETNDLISNKYSTKKTNNIIYYPDIKGEFFFNLIGNADLVIAFHGMLTSIAAIQNTKVLDLFNCDIKSKEDFYKYKNAFHEFKPNLNNYEFIIPKKNLKISIRKIKNIITYGRKINN